MSAGSGFNDLGAVLSAGVGSAINFGFNARQASTSWDRQKNWATRGPGYMMQGLRAAGLNPILAAQGGFSAGASKAPQASGTSSDVSPIAGGQRGLMRAQTSAARALQLKTDQERALIAVNTQLQNLDVPSRTKMAAWLASPAGQAAQQLKIENDALPNTTAGAVIKAGKSLIGPARSAVKTRAQTIKQPGESEADAAKRYRRELDELSNRTRPRWVRPTWSK